MSKTKKLTSRVNTPSAPEYTENDNYPSETRSESFIFVSNNREGYRILHESIADFELKIF